MGARAPTLITGQLAPQRRQLPQLIERSAFVRSRRNGSSTVDQDIAAEPKIVAGAAKLVENGPRATDVAFERSRSLVLTVRGVQERSGPSVRGVEEPADLRTGVIKNDAFRFRFLSWQT